MTKVDGQCPNAKLVCYSMVDYTFITQQIQYMNSNQQINNHLLLDMIHSNNFIHNHDLSTNHTNQLMFIRLISNALKASLQRYQANYKSPNHITLQPHQQPQQTEQQQIQNTNRHAKGPINHYQNIIEIISDSQEQQKNIKLSPKAKNHTQIIRKLTQPAHLIKEMVVAEKKLDLQIITTFKQAYKIKGQGHNRQKRSRIQVIGMNERQIPVVDLISTAYIPAFGLNYDSKKAKKERLMRRQVIVWKESDLNKKNKHLRSLVSRL